MVSEKIYKVFVSSTYEDLREERAAVEKGLLQLGCLPVGMELFPAADEETWNFIKSQIDDSDYYVVVIAGRYGSQAPDGISFTEKEYDYAIAQKKPAIGFVHGDPGSIAANKTETSQKARTKLENFIEKVKKRPVRPFKSPHELALEVTTSFVQLMRDRPAVGYVRTDASVDFKRYSELLEENRKLKEDLNAAQQSLETVPFPAHLKPIRLTIVNVGNAKTIRTVDSSLRQAFQAVAEGALLYQTEHMVLNHAANLLLGEPENGNTTIGFNLASVKTLRRELMLFGLIEVQGQHGGSLISWRLTDYGRRQLAAIAP
jgi:hypothetical protein